MLSRDVERLAAGSSWADKRGWCFYAHRGMTERTEAPRRLGDAFGATD
jgi:hypothetical protein